MNEFAQSIAYVLGAVIALASAVAVIISKRRQYEVESSARTVKAQKAEIDSLRRSRRDDNDARIKMERELQLQITALQAEVAILQAADNTDTATAVVKGIQEVWSPRAFAEAFADVLEERKM